MNHKMVYNLVRKSKSTRLLWRRGLKKKMNLEEDFFPVLMIINPNFLNYPLYCKSQFNENTYTFNSNKRF